MQLKLHENIKKFRKEKNLTQEKLAEILDVTVGAVSKWENGNNTPDILMLTKLADFFDVSVDVLLGYDISSKKVKDIVAGIQKASMEHHFDEALALTRDALTRYPHSFSVLHGAAMMFHVKAVECKDIDAAKEAIRFFEHAKEYLSQNDNPEINAFTINNMIATDYMFFDEKKALKTLKDNNFGGVNHSLISLACLEAADTRESLHYSTNAMITNLAGMITSSSCMILALASTRKKKDCNSALAIADTAIRLIKLYKTEEAGYFSKHEAFFHILKAYIFALLHDEESMHKSIETGKRLANEFDANTSNNLATNIRFYYAQKASYLAVDSIGNSARAGIDALLGEQFVKIPGLDQNVLRRIRDLYN